MKNTLITPSYIPQVYSQIDSSAVLVVLSGAQHLDDASRKLLTYLIDLEDPIRLFREDEILGDYYTHFAILHSIFINIYLYLYFLFIIYFFRMHHLKQNKNNLFIFLIPRNCRFLKISLIIKYRK